MSEEYSQKIRKWLNEKGSTPEEFKSDTESVFKFRYRETPITVGFLKVNPDSISIAWKSILDESEQKQMKYVNKKEILEIKKLLCQLHLQYDFTYSGETLREIYISREIFFDVLTKDKFYEAVYDIFNSVSFMKDSLLSLGQPSSKN